MTINFVSLIFIWLLPLTASRSVTSGQNHNFTNVMTGEEGNKFTHNQLTTQKASSLNRLLEVSGDIITQSIIGDVNSTEEETTTKPSTESSLQMLRTMLSKTFLPNIQTAVTPNPISSQLNSSTVGMKSTTDVQFKVTSATMVVTSQGGNPTTTRLPAMLSRSTQSQDTGKTSTSQLRGVKITYSSTRPKQPTNLISTTTTSAKPKCTKPVTGGEAVRTKDLNKTSMAMTKTPFIHITKAKKSEDPPEKNENSKKGTNHSKAVAGLIGGSLVLMMVGFLVIYTKKQKLLRQQIKTRDWAGPSPFLEGGAENGQVTLRSSNRTSVSNFLPQWLSNRLSFLPETDEELEDMTPGTTFGDKHQGSTFDQEVDGNYVQDSNVTALVVPEMQRTGDSPDTVETSLSVLSEQPAVDK